MDLILIHAEAETLVRAAILFEEKHFHFEAERSLLRARELYTTLLEADLDANLPGLVRLLILLATVYTSERKFKQATTMLDEAEVSNGGRVEIVMARARLSGQMGSYATAAKLWEELLGIESTKFKDRAIAYRHLATLASERDEQVLASTYFEESIALCEVSDNEGSGKMFLAYGGTLIRSGNFIEARKMLTNAVELLGPLTIVKENIYKEDLPALIINLIITYDALNEKVEAALLFAQLKELQLIYKEALQTDIDPLIGLIYARTLGWMRSYYIREQDIDSAKQAAQKAIDLYQQLELINPGTYLDRLAEALHDQGTIFRNNEEYKNAGNCYSEAITIRRKLAEDYPDIYEPGLAKDLRSLARMYMRMKDDWQASLTMQGATAIYERLASIDPDLYEVELASCYRVLGQLIYENRSRSEAKGIWTKWLPLQERLTAKNPLKEEVRLLSLLQRLVTYSLNYNRLDDAAGYFEQMLATKERYKNDNPLSYDSDLALIYRDMARAANMGALMDEAEIRYQLSLDHFQKAQRSDKYDQTVHIQVLHELVEMYVKMAGMDPTLAFLQKELDVYEKMESLEPDMHQGAIAALLTAMGSVHGDMGDLISARACRDKASAIYETLINTGQRQYVVLLADNIFWLAILCGQNGDLNEADEMYRHCIGIYEKEIGGTFEDLNLKYANVLNYYGHFLIACGKVDAGRRMLSRGADIARSTAADGEAEKMLIGRQK